MLILDSEAGNYVVSEGKSYSYFAGNNYLGLSYNQLVKETSIHAIGYMLRITASVNHTGEQISELLDVFKKWRNKYGTGNN